MSRGWSVRTGLCAVLVALMCAPAASGAVSRPAALAIAMRAFGPAGRGSPLTVFSLPAPLSARTRVDENGPGPGERVTVRRERFGSRLIIRESSRGIGRRAWLFWADLFPDAEFSHPSVLVLVDAKTGSVLRVRRLLWEPLINGQLPPFLSSARGYIDSTYRVFSRAVDRRARSAARRAPPAATAAQAAPTGQLGAGLQSAFGYAQSRPGFGLRQTPQLRPGPGTTSIASPCGVSVGVRDDPFGNAPPWFGTAAGGVRWSSSGPARQLGNTVLFGCGNADLSADCAIVLYGKADPLFDPNVRKLAEIAIQQLGDKPVAATSLADLELDLSTLPARCREVTLMVMAHGAGPDTPWLAPGTLLLPQTRFSLATTFDDDLISPNDLRQILAQHPGRTYNLLIDSCYSGNWTSAVNGTVVTSSAAGEESFGAKQVPGEKPEADAFLQNIAAGLLRWRATQGSVTLTAVPAQGSHFVRWESPQGYCAGAGPQCVVRPSSSGSLIPVIAHFGITAFNLTVDNTNPDGGMVTCCNPGRDNVLPGIVCGHQPNGTIVLVYTECSATVRQPQYDGDHVGLQLSATIAPGIGTYGIVAPVAGCDPALSTYTALPAPGGGTYYATANCVFDATGDTTITVHWTFVSTQAN